MPRPMNPYDDGSVLEPKPHIRQVNGEWIAGRENRRPAETSDFGRVDFDDDHGQTLFTGMLVKTEDGYLLRLDEHQDVPVVFETSSDRELRQDASDRITQALAALRPELPETLTYEEDGDTSAFAHGHLSIRDVDDPTTAFYVTMNYVGTNPIEDPDAVPNTFTWHIEYNAFSADGDEYDLVRLEGGEVGPEGVDELLAAVRKWVRLAEGIHIPHWLLDRKNEVWERAVTMRDRFIRADILYPENWDDMGSSERDLWEEREYRRLREEHDEPATQADQLASLNHGFGGTIAPPRFTSEAESDEFMFGRMPQPEPRPSSPSPGM